jgi:hypothetical protein
VTHGKCGRVITHRLRAILISISGLSPVCGSLFRTAGSQNPESTLPVTELRGATGRERPNREAVMDENALKFL